MNNLITCASTPAYVQKRIPALDGLRALAILMVVTYHYIAVPISPESSKGYMLIRQALSKNWSGVDLFFVLSGFLIAGILIDNKNATNYFKVFYLRRIFRIFPLYYFTIALFVVLNYVATNFGLINEQIFSNSLPLFSYLLSIQNFFMVVQGTFGNEFLAITWSLAIEEQFYLFLPLVIRYNQRKRLPFILFFLICFSITLRAVVGKGTFLAFVMMPWRLDGLLLGAVLAIIIRDNTILNILKKNVRWIKIISTLLFIYLTYCTWTEPLGTLSPIFVFSMFYTLIIFLSISEQNSLLSRFFCNAFMVKIGKISYGIYLLHQMVNGIAHEIFLKKLPSFDNYPAILITLFAFIITYLMANILYNSFEKKFIDIGHKINYIF